MPTNPESLLRTLTLILSLKKNSEERGRLARPFGKPGLARCAGCVTGRPAKKFAAHEEGVPRGA